MDTPNGHCMIMSPAGLDRFCMLARGHRSLSHVDQSGYEWSDGGQLSGDRARRIREERLRKLLTYLENQAVVSKGDDDEEIRVKTVYEEVALHLKNILDAS